MSESQSQSEPEPEKLTITVQMYHYAYATKEDNIEIYSVPTQVECYSDESLFAKLQRLVPMQFWHIVYDEWGKIWVYQQSSDAKKRSRIDKLQDTLMHNPTYRPTFYIFDSRTNADINPVNSQRPVGLGMTGSVPALATLLSQLNSGLQTHAGSPAVARREIKFIEKFDRAAIGWTEDAEDAGLGPRYAQKTHILHVSENESLFDQLLRRASWEHWQFLRGRDHVHPTHFVEWTGSGTVDATRALVNEWQHELFRHGDGNKGFLLLRHEDPNFDTRLLRTRTRRKPALQTPTRTPRTH